MWIYAFIITTPNQIILIPIQLLGYRFNVYLDFKMFKINVHLKKLFGQHIFSVGLCRVIFNLALPNQGVVDSTSARALSTRLRRQIMF